MNTAVIWSRIAQLHYEDLYEICLHRTALKNLLPKVPFDHKDCVVAASNFFEDIQPNLRKDNIRTDSMEAENEFLEKYLDLQIPDHLSNRFRRSSSRKVRNKRIGFDQGVPIFQPQAGTRLEDWYLCVLQNPEHSNTTAHLFHVCPYKTSKDCLPYQNISHIPFPSQDEYIQGEEDLLSDDPIHITQGGKILLDVPGGNSTLFDPEVDELTSLKHVNNLDTKPKPWPKRNES